MTGESNPPVEPAEPHNNETQPEPDREPSNETCGVAGEGTEREQKQRLIRHAFERCAALSSQDARTTTYGDPRYRRVWSHRLEQLAEQGVQRLLRETRS